MECCLNAPNIPLLSNVYFGSTVILCQGTVKLLELYEDCSELSGWIGDTLICVTDGEPLFI